MERRRILCCIWNDVGEVDEVEEFEEVFFGILDIFGFPDFFSVYTDDCIKFTNMLLYNQ